MFILDLQSDLFFTVFKIGQIWPKIPQNGDFLNFSTLVPRNTSILFILSLLVVFLAIQAICLKKWLKIQIYAFLNDFEKNGSMCGKMGLRKAWDGSYDFVFHPET